MNVYYHEAETTIANQITAAATQAEQFLLQQFCTDEAQKNGQIPLAGAFSLHSEQTESDLYGMIDAVYILYTIGNLEERTTIGSRQQWAEAILACQDEQGWFSKRNLRGHSREHATAYALGALTLLEMESEEQYLVQVKPIVDLLPILTEYDTFQNWITYLQFRFTLKDIVTKNVGWHHIWRGSHIGGGIAAIAGMLEPMFQQWWPGQVDSEQWFGWYFSWLDAHVNPVTGYWQRAFWNHFYRKPTLIDMGGAVHFFWVYEACKRPLPCPANIIKSTISLQRDNGLYKNHPFCIDLDGNFCVIRSYLQLSGAVREQHTESVYQSVQLNFEGILRALRERPLNQIYSDSHGLPGALAALVECKKLPNFLHRDALRKWRNPLDKAWWL